MKNKAANPIIHIACIAGTRPEIIKMAPVIFALRTCSWAKITIINTAQHRQLLDDMLNIFGLHPDYDLNIMKKNQSLGELTGHLCAKLDELFPRLQLDAVLGVGDTTSVMVASLIAFYHKIPFGHIEAGLRTFDNYQPFPEEINRVLTANLSTWHFAPTQREKDNLVKENLNASTIYVTGNPVIDALYWTLEHTKQTKKLSVLKRYIIVTTHRRENFGDHLKNICEAVIKLSQRFTDIEFVVPVHPNPNVKKMVSRLLAKRERIHLISALKYDEFSHLLQHCLLVLTDSGGIQEEAPALHKPVIVLRDKTERPAIIEAGVGILAGTKTDDIVTIVSLLLTHENLYKKMAKGASPYGDGHAAEYIVAILKRLLLEHSATGDPETKKRMPSYAINNK